MGTAATHFAGIDVSKDTLDACLIGPDDRTRGGQFPNAPEGYAALLAWADRHAAGRVVHFGLEASRTLLADLPELGTRPPGTLAALAGLAPFAADSGRSRGQRHIQGGRKEVRRALYLGALAAARVPGPLREFAQRLKAKGKASKVVLIAVARKLLVIANAIVRDGRPWEVKVVTPA